MKYTYFNEDASIIEWCLQEKNPTEGPEALLNFTTFVDHRKNHSIMGGH